MKTSRLLLASALALTLAVVSSGVPASRGQSIEEQHDAARMAYDETLNQLELCSEGFFEFQQWFKANRPRDGAPKNEWDEWATKYKFQVTLFIACMKALKAKADKLRKKLDELEKQLDSISLDDSESRQKKGKTDEAKKFLKKAKTDLSDWQLDVKYKVGLLNSMSRKAAADYESHGSGKVKIELSIKVDF